MSQSSRHASPSQQSDEAREKYKSRYDDRSPPAHKSPRNGESYNRHESRDRLPRKYSKSSSHSHNYETKRRDDYRRQSSPRYRRSPDRRYEDRYRGGDEKYSSRYRRSRSPRHRSDRYRGYSRDRYRGRSRDYERRRYDDDEYRRDRSPRRLTTVPEEDKNQGKTLYCHGIGKFVKDEELMAHFDKFGKIEDLHVVRDPFSKQSRGFAFVTFEISEDAGYAVKELNGKDFNGQELRVELSRRKKAHTPTPGRYCGPKSATSNYRYKERYSPRGGRYERRYDDYEPRHRSSRRQACFEQEGAHLRATDVLRVDRENDQLSLLFTKFQLIIIPADSLRLKLYKKQVTPMNGYESHFASDSQDEQIRRLKETNQSLKSKIMSLSEQLKEAVSKADMVQAERERRALDFEKELKKKEEVLRKQTRHIMGLKKEIESINAKIETTGGLEKAVALESEIKIAKRTTKSLQEEIKYLQGIQKTQALAIEKYNKDTELPDKVQAMKDELDRKKKRMKELEAKHKEDQKEVNAAFQHMLKVEDRYRQLKEYEKASREGNNSMYGSQSASSKLRSSSKKGGSSANLDTSTQESDHGREYQLLQLNIRTEQRNFYVWKKQMEQKKETLEKAKKELAQKIKRQAEENQNNAAQIQELKLKVKDKKNIYSKHQDLIQQKQERDLEDKKKELQRLKDERVKEFEKRGLIRKSIITTYTDRKKAEFDKKKSGDMESQKRLANLSRLDDIEDGKQELLKKSAQPNLPQLTEANLHKHNDILSKSRDGLLK